jgi:hypothetical protein
MVNVLNAAGDVLRDYLQICGSAVLMADYGID